MKKDIEWFENCNIMVILNNDNDFQIMVNDIKKFQEYLNSNQEFLHFQMKKQPYISINKSQIIMVLYRDLKDKKKRKRK